MVSISTTEATELFRRPPERFIDVGGASVAYRRVGQGPDVLFVHGWPVTSATYRRLLPTLAEHVTCHLVDFAGAGDSRFDDASPLSIDLHIASVRRVVDELGLDDVALVGHDSGGLIARHAMAGDPRLRAMALLDTEQTGGITWRFRSFLIVRHLPAIGAVLGRSIGRRRLRQSPLLLGDAFVDRSAMEGDFYDLCLRPLVESAPHRKAAERLLRSLDTSLIDELPTVHRRIDVPVQLVWGARDKFFPVAQARTMVDTFPDARLTVIPDAGLFAHEERPAEVAAAMLPVLAGTR